MGRRAVRGHHRPGQAARRRPGLSDIGNEPKPVEGPWDGTLSAVMLDTKRTFDDSWSAPTRRTPTRRRRILDNRFYRNISGALSGTQEYMAMEKLYCAPRERTTSTWSWSTRRRPGTRSTSSTRPGRLTHFLDHRLYRTLMAPTRGHA